MKRLIAGVLLGLCSTWSYAAVQGKEIDYAVGTQVFKGYLAYDDAVKGKRPGVLVVHEWWGHNEYVRTRARMLAALGYTALALDMYGDGKQAHHPEDANKFATVVRSDMALAEQRFAAADAVLRQHASVDPQRIAAIGYCFGGGVVLGMARRGADLAGVVSFHGSLGTTGPRAQKGAVKAKVLVEHGADDPFVKPEEITQFKKEMEDAGVDYRFDVYPGAQHSFTDPGADEHGKKFKLPLAYNKAADEQSWAAMQLFFKKIFELR